MSDGRVRVTYYASTPLRGGAATAIFRHYKEDTRLPERYTREFGWIADKRILLELMNGNLGPADMVSEEEALGIVSRLDEK